MGRLHVSAHKAGVMDSYLSRTRVRSKSVPRSLPTADGNHKMADDGLEQTHQGRGKTAQESEASQATHGTVIDYAQLAKAVADIIVGSGVNTTGTDTNAHRHSLPRKEHRRNA